MKSIRSIYAPVAAGMALAFLTCSTALAADEKTPPRAKDSRDQAIESRVAAPNARLAALIAAGGKIVQNKGVESVKRIDTGTYCIKPKASTGIDPKDSIAIVSVEFYWSTFNEVMVQWASRGSGCPSDSFGVYTLGDFNLTARYKFSNDVGFSILVP
jgi:hypothetical protein